MPPNNQQIPDPGTTPPANVSPVPTQAPIQGYPDPTIQQYPQGYVAPQPQVPAQQVDPGYYPPQVGMQPQYPQQPGIAQPQTPEQQQAVEQKKASTNQSTTQKSLLFSELRDGMVIMADGSFRAVIACESINFDLMSNREREGIEYSYQNFLNSLNFDIQIFIRSKRVDIAPYIDKLEGIRRSQDNMLLGVLMDDYIDFIEALAEEANIMDKSFYIIVPYSPAPDGEKLVEKGKGFFGQFLPKSAANITKIDNATYQKAKDEIANRVDSVMSGLFQIGVTCAQLTTKELGELYYNVYNPDTAVNQPLGDFENATATYVRKGQGAAPKTSLQEGSMQ